MADEIKFPLENRDAELLTSAIGRMIQATPDEAAPQPFKVVEGRNDRGDQILQFTFNSEEEANLVEDELKSTLGAYKYDGITILVAPYVVKKLMTESAQLESILEDSSPGQNGGVTGVKIKHISESLAQEAGATLPEGSTEGFHMQGGRTLPGGYPVRGQMAFVVGHEAAEAIAQKVNGAHVDNKYPDRVTSVPTFGLEAA